MDRLEIAVRLAMLEDLSLCLALDASYQSDEVWQMQMETLSESEGLAVRFRRTRLPRRLTAAYPRDSDELRGNWQQQDCFLVATIPDGAAEEAGDGDRIIGYIDLHEQRWQRTGWVQNLVVDRPYRRRGVGTTLLRAAAAWARHEGLRRLTLECPTKNGGAIRFFFGRGAEFCGFNDRYYTHGDIALFFDYRL